MSIIVKAYGNVELLCIYYSIHLDILHISKDLSFERFGNIDKDIYNRMIISSKMGFFQFGGGHHNIILPRAPEGHKTALADTTANLKVSRGVLQGSVIIEF